MAKPRQPVSPPSPEPTQEEQDFSTAHPLMRNQTQAQQAVERMLARQKADEFKIKEVAEWKACVNAVASSTEGRLFLKSMLQYSGMWEPPALTNANRMVTNSIKSAFYLTWVRPYLQPDVRKELEG